MILAVSVLAYYHFVYLPKGERRLLERRIKPLIDAGLTEEEALEFDEAYRGWAPYNKTVAKYAGYWINHPPVSEAILRTSGLLEYTVPSLDLIVPNIANKTLTQDTLIDFMVKNPFIVKDDGLNATDMQLIKYYAHVPGVVDKVIEKIRSQKDRLFALDELTPYTSKPLTEEQAHHLIEKWYPELFKGCEENGVPVVFGDLDEDKLNHYEEIFELGTDPFKYNTWIRFVFDFTRKPSDFYEGSTDTRDLAAAFDSIQFLDRNSSVLATVEFAPEDEKYLRKGWYPIEYLVYPIEYLGDKDISWAGKNATIFLDDLDILDRAHFLRIMADPWQINIILYKLVLIKILLNVLSQVFLSHMLILTSR